MSIYTRRGDGGKTDLHSGERVGKDEPRIEAIGTVDELNCLIGKAASHSQDEELIESLHQIQDYLHVCQTDLANTDDSDHPRIDQAMIDWLETTIDDADEELEPLEDFILQGGHPVAAELFHGRAVCRRAERRIVQLAVREEVNEDLVSFINRLSDTLFTLARLVNHRHDIEERHPSYGD